MARLLFILNLIFILSSEFVRAQDTIPLNVIRNEKSVPSEMNMDQLKAVLRGEKLRWNDGAKVSIALMKTNTDVGVKTCERIYNMTANELNKYFLALVFQGKVKAPTFFSSLSDLEEYVAQTPGAIGVVEHTEKELNIITVDGKKQI
tara:strand:- start:294 stop:734 length:441 start_codon:yes stop_codon:yes gene_type:complete